MEKQHELNFLDLCAACGRAIGRACVACWHLLGYMVRLSVRYWWLVVTIVALAIAAALYYTRFENLNFKVNGIVLLNGPTIQQFERSYTPMYTGVTLAPYELIAPFVWHKTIRDFRTYRVIDAKGDGTADWIDFDYKSNPLDTSNVQMQDRLCLQFRMKCRKLDSLPEVETAILSYLNASPVLLQAYDTYMQNMREEAAFNHRQAEKLDSLTSCYYFNPASEATPRSSGVSFYGDREIKLFLQDIYKQHEHMRQMDHRLQLATAPITLENHFSIDPTPTNSRKKFLPLFILFGWLFACGLAEIIDKRKAICAWLKQ